MILRNKDSILNTLILLHESFIDFRLTGSHFFGGAIPGSDIDFYTEDTRATRAFLKELNFVQLNNGSTYDDRSITYVYRYSPTKGDGCNMAKHIDVQLIHPSYIVVKDMAQKTLYRKFGGRGLIGDKQTHNELWNDAMLEAGLRGK